MSRRCLIFLFDLMVIVTIIPEKAMWANMGANEATAPSYEHAERR